MTYSTMFTSVFGFTMLLFGVLLTAFEFGRISRHRLDPMRPRPQRIDEARDMQGRHGR